MSDKSAKKNRISMREISELAGVSVATVSRVINDNGRFSEKTRQRVKRVIDEYDYIPSAIARGLRTNKVEVIGIIVPDIVNEFFARLALIVQKELFRYGYSTLIYNTDEIDEIEQKHISALIAQNVSGIIHISDDHKIKRQMLRLNVPTVYVDRTRLGDEQGNCATVESDNEMGGYMAGRELISAGCKNPIILADERKLMTQINRYKGYLRALTENQMVLPQDAVLYVEKVDYETAYKKVADYLHTGREVDGIFATTDWLAVGAIKCLSDHGYKVPQQVKVVGFDDISIAAFGPIPLTTIKQDVDTIGSFASETLINMMAGAKVTEKNQTIPVTLIKRETT